MTFAASHAPDSQATPPISGSGGEPSLADEELDPELLALPDPPKQGRVATALLLLLTAFASVAMVVALRRDVAYAFASRVPRELGELAPGALGAGGVKGNELVHLHARVGAAGAIRYERPFESVSFRLAPVVGHPDLWVELHVPEGAESGRFAPPREFSGRLVPFAKAGPKHRGLEASIAASTGSVVPEGAWILAEGERPENARWAVALVALFAAFAAWNVITLTRLLRRVRE
ncbi:MAG TPA: hypothetical protein PLR99_26090 [Polyangiaceae bacterium]|nr:hypothetical protein [Polyangiaceae bacterium]